VWAIAEGRQAARAADEWLVSQGGDQAAGDQVAVA
jgi:NADPH-dependent glutamate synthase beta subunit-like oxidoreductase